MYKPKQINQTISVFIAAIGKQEKRGNFLAEDPYTHQKTVCKTKKNSKNSPVIKIVVKMNKECRCFSCFCCKFYEYVSLISIIDPFVLFSAANLLLVEPVVQLLYRIGKSIDAFIAAVLIVSLVDLLAPLSTQLVPVFNNAVLCGKRYVVSLSLVFDFPETLVVIMRLLIKLLVAVDFALELVESG